jgi:nitroreductase
MMNALEALQTRTASPRLIEPAPHPNELEEVLKCAMRAPDHGMLRPWRYLLVRGDARRKLGELFVRARKPSDEVQTKKLLEAPLRAPLVIIAVATIKETDKIPALEQICSVGAGIQNMSVALHAMGYASIWRSGGVCYDPAVNQALGLAETDQIVGYLYVGTATVERQVPSVDAAEYVQEWTGV